MKPITRGTLAAALTCVAAAACAVSATPAAALGTVPVVVPLESAEEALGMELPEVSGEIPVAEGHAYNGLRYTEGRLLPELPVEAGAPGARLRAPAPEPLGKDTQIVALDVPAAEFGLGPGK
ncbi:hypothetical protein ACH4F6_07730 [Streptomyces sp. NPDC017936]|uniref:hypothetical protein n=1 Tax=Streptomyces sp. NPDC017936 TaxID=3365016 RepID=UPI00378E3707